MLAMIEVNARAMTDEFLARSAKGSFNREATAIYVAELARRRDIATAAEIRLNRLAEGRCVNCGRPDAGGECAICTVSYAPFDDDTYAVDMKAADDEAMLRSAGVEL